MRILFIVKDLEYVEPFGIMYLSSAVKRFGHQVNMLGTRNTNIFAEIKRIDPQIIAYSCTTGVHKYYLALNREIKQRFKNVFSVFGGPHPTFFPQIIDDDCVDAVCIGEGESAFVELANRLETKQDISGIRNFWIKQDGIVYKNPVRDLVEDLDSLPFPDRQLRYDIVPKSQDYPLKQFVPSRGCPYQCSYCFNSSLAKMYGNSWKKVRTRSVDNLLEEISDVRSRYPLEFVLFSDSIFGFHKEWLVEFAEKYPRQIGRPYYCHVRADLITPETAELLRTSGCKSVNMGIETGNDYLRNFILKRNMSKEQIKNACDLLHKHGIKILSDNILGLPGETLQQAMETLKLNIKCRIDYPLVTLLQPYPSTAICEYAIKNGHYDGAQQNIKYNYYFSSPLKFRTNLEKRRIENLQKLFAITVEAPFLLPFVYLAVNLPQNLFFYNIFRTWYMYSYHRRITSHRFSIDEIKDFFKVVFGIYKKEADYAQNG